MEEWPGAKTGDELAKEMFISPSWNFGDGEGDWK